MIKPTVGRVVDYHPHVDDGGDINGQPHAATIAHVFSERLVNLSVVNENGSQYSRQNVPLLQDDDAAPADGNYAAWMDYQKGQAAKTEAAIAAAPDLQPVHAKIDAVASDVHTKIAAVEAGTQTRFEQLGDWLKTTYETFEQKLEALKNQPPTTPAPAPETAAGGTPAANA